MAPPRNAMKIATIASMLALSIACHAQSDREISIAVNRFPDLHPKIIVSDTMAPDKCLGEYYQGVITLYPNREKSTLLHEYAHYFFEQKYLSSYSNYKKFQLESEIFACAIEALYILERQSAVSFMISGVNVHWSWKDKDELYKFISFYLYQ